MATEERGKCIMLSAGGGITILISKISWQVVKSVFWGLARLFCTQRNMEGTWLTAFAADGKIHEEVVKAAQFSRWVRGVIEYHEKSRQYAFSGTIRDSVLVGKYEIRAGGSVRDRGSFTLAGNRVGELRTLDGCYAWTDDRTQRPLADDYIWIKATDTKLSDRLETVNSSIQGTGLRATRDFEPGELLGYFEGVPVENNSRYSLTLDARHIEPSGVLRHINHSCRPNAKFRDRWLVADQRIAKNQEVTIDYTITESMINHGFDCNCRTDNCRGHIGTASASVAESARN